MAERAEIEAYDAETVDETPNPAGPAVDPPVRPVTFADVVDRFQERRPIVPASLRTKAGRRSLLTWAGAAGAYNVAFHASRSWLYAAKVAWYAPHGLWVALSRPIWWARAEEGNWQLRQHAATTLDADTWLRLDNQRIKQARPRWAALITGAIGVAIAALVLYFLAPWWAQYTAAAAVVLLLARIGRPMDKPIIDYVVDPNRYIRLTAELTRKALVAAVIAIKDPGGIRFEREIYRDGPGYSAIVSLPTGVIATDVIDRRDYLSAGFQLPIAQVWPEPVKGAHPGVLAIWVADRPVDRMKQRTTPLLTCKELDYWGPLPWGCDVRMRPVFWRVNERNSIFGGMPGSGKTLAARNVALGLALDPLVQFVISELKGSGDFDCMEQLCVLQRNGDRLYASGAGDDAKERSMEILHWLDRECDRRGPAIRKWAARGFNTENKLNRRIALADPSLFPLAAIFDEIQELLTDPELGKEAKRLLTSIVKRGRSLGIHVIPATQRIDKESVPRGISSNISNKLCLAVPSHVETDLILGTGAYARGARPTTFVPPADDENPWAGWGYLAGRDQPVRADFINNPTAEAIVARALGMRGDQAPVDDGQGDERDILADVIRVFAHTNRQGLHWQQLAELLAEEHPSLYGDATGEVISAQVRAKGVPSAVVAVDGQNARGCRRRDVEAVQVAAIGGSNANGDAPVSEADE